jgi:hypothetical protein
VLIEEATDRLSGGASAHQGRGDFDVEEGRDDDLVPPGEER